MSLNKEQTLSLLTFFDVDHKASQNLATLGKLLPSLDEAIVFLMGLPDPLEIPKDISDLLTSHYGESIIMTTEQQQPPTEQQPTTEQPKTLQDLVEGYLKGDIQDGDLKSHLATLKISVEKFTAEIYKLNVITQHTPKDPASLKDDWTILENIKIGDNVTSLILFSWLPDIVFSSKDIPLGLGWPRTYEQFLSFIESNNLEMLFSLDVSVDSGEPKAIMLSSSDGITTKEVDTLVESIYMNKAILQKLVVKASCFSEKIWEALDKQLERINPKLYKDQQRKGGFRGIQYNAASTPLLKAVAAHGKALKSSTEVF